MPTFAILRDALEPENGATQCQGGREETQPEAQRRPGLDSVWAAHVVQRTRYATAADSDDGA